MAVTDLLTWMVLTFTSALVWMTVGRHLAFAWQWLDHPGGRKHHAEPTPLHGGVAMFLAILPALFWQACLDPSLWYFLGAVSMIVVIGVIDDFRPLCAKQRFLLQALTAGILCWQGKVLLLNFGNLIGFGDIVLSPALALLITPVAMIGVINAINMLDGVDGLAASLVFQALCWIAGLMAVTHITTYWVICLSTLASILAYLCLNFPWRANKPAVLFMGDAGSMLLGLILVWFAIILSQRPHQSAPAVLFLWLFALPLYDTGQVMWKRFRQKKSLFSPDRGHLHHVLLDRGLGVTQVVVQMNVFAFVCAAAGACMWTFGVAEYYLMGTFVLGFFLFIAFVQYLRILEGEDIELIEK